MLLNVYGSLITFGNTSKVDTNSTMNEKKKKNQLIIVYNASTFKKKKKKNELKDDIILRGRQVVLYVDQ